MALIPCLMLPNNRKVNHKSLVQNYEQLKLDEYVVYDQCFEEGDFDTRFTYIGHADKRMGWVTPRNELLKYFYNSDFDYAFWIDANSTVSGPTLNDLITIIDAIKNDRLDKCDAIFGTLGMWASQERITLKSQADFFDYVHILPTKNNKSYNWMHGLFHKNFKKYYGQEFYIDERCDTKQGTADDVYFARLLQKFTNSYVAPTVVINKPSSKASCTWANDKGKHNPILLATAVYEIYYNLTGGYDNIFFDFDDTIWPRNDALSCVGRDNVRLLSKFKKDAVIVSGNTMESVKKHIKDSIGDLDSFFFFFWADANTTKMYRGKIVETLDELTLPDGVEDIIKELEKYNVNPVAMRAGSQNITCIKIKPLHKRERVILLDLLNKYLIPLYCKDMNVVARSTGTTTIDIMKQNNDKLVVFHRYSKGLEGYGNFLYIGDEVDSGNDVNIALACNNSIHVKDVKETNLILRLLTSNL